MECYQSVCNICRGDDSIRVQVDEQLSFDSLTSAAFSIYLNPSSNIQSSTPTSSGA